MVAAAGVPVPEQMETGPERRAVETARQFSKRVIIEAMVDSTELRILVIDHKVVAAAGTQRLHHAAMDEAPADVSDRSVENSKS